MDEELSEVLKKHEEWDGESPHPYGCCDGCRALTIALLLTSHSFDTNTHRRFRDLFSIFNSDATDEEKRRLAIEKLEQETGSISDYMETLKSFSCWITELLSHS